MCFEKFTFKIVSFVLATNSFVLKVIISYFVPAIKIAFNYLVLNIAIAITSFVVKVAFAIAVLALWRGAASVAVEDEEEREAEKPKGWF